MLPTKVTRHTLYASACSCGHVTRAAGVLDETIREAGCAVMAVEDEMAQDIEQAVLLHADETPWKEAGKPLWMWVFVAGFTTLLYICSRGLEILSNVLTDKFKGNLMSDGYQAYRHLGAAPALLGALDQEVPGLDRLHRRRGSGRRQGHARCAAHADGGDLRRPRRARPGNRRAGDQARRRHRTPACAVRAPSRFALAAEPVDMRIRIVKVGWLVLSVAAKLVQGSR